MNIKYLLFTVLILQVSFQACTDSGEEFIKGVTSDALKKAILKAHNDYRQKVANAEETNGFPSGPQPGATNMALLKWSDDLAKKSQEYSNKCGYGHSTKDERGNTATIYIGENIAINSQSKEISEPEEATVTKLIGLWYDEVKIFKKTQIGAFKNEKVTTAEATAKGFSSTSIGHYTQVVWAETTEIGCSVTLYKKTSNNFYSTYLVCRYNPGGNIISKPIYKESSASKAKCSECPTGQTCHSTYTALCAASDYSDGLATGGGGGNGNGGSNSSILMVQLIGIVALIALIL